MFTHDSYTAPRQYAWCDLGQTYLLSAMTHQPTMAISPSYMAITHSNMAVPVWIGSNCSSEKKTLLELTNKVKINNILEALNRTHGI